MIDEIMVLYNGVSMAQTPVPQLNPIWFVDRFVAATTRGVYREAFIFCGHHGGIDIYTRMSADEPMDSFEVLTCTVTDPTLWWSSSTEPMPSGRVEIHPRSQWHYVPMQVRSSTSMLGIGVLMLRAIRSRLAYMIYCCY